MDLETAQPCRGAALVLGQTCQSTSDQPVKAPNRRKNHLHLPSSAETRTPEASRTDPSSTRLHRVPSIDLLFFCLERSEPRSNAQPCTLPTRSSSSSPHTGDRVRLAGAPHCSGRRHSGQDLPLQQQRVHWKLHGRLLNFQRARGLTTGAAVGCLLGFFLSLTLRENLRLFGERALCARLTPPAR